MELQRVGHTKVTEQKGIRTKKQSYHAGKILFHLIDGDVCVYLKMILGNSLVIQ